MTILFCLAQKDGINAKDVADLTRQPQNTLSRGAEILERKGLITRRTDQRDRRRNIMHITEQGLKCYGRIQILYEEAEERMLPRWTARTWPTWIGFYQDVRPCRRTERLELTSFFS